MSKEPEPKVTTSAYTGEKIGYLEPGPGDNGMTTGGEPIHDPYDSGPWPPSQVSSK